MNSLTVRAIESIDFKPATEQEEVEQNLRFIVLTAISTVPLFREFAFQPTMLDKPINVIQAQFSAELIKKAKTYEPRAVIQRIDYSESSWHDGKIQPTVFYNLIE